jgi:hypothetical protein
MQIIEVSEVGVRAAVLRLVSPKAKLTWILFPMVHLAERPYFKQMDRLMNECDLVLTEGVRSGVARALTASYRLASDPNHGRVVQPEPGRAIQSSNADMASTEFDDAWRRLPFAWRAGLPLIAPLYGIWLRYFARPLEWQAELATDDLPTNEEVLQRSDSQQVWTLLGARRESKLFAEMAKVQIEWAGTQKSVGVAWGARHIGAIAEFLSKRWGYFAQSACWVTVFDYTKQRYAGP